MTHGSCGFIPKSLIEVHLKGDFQAFQNDLSLYQKPEGTKEAEQKDETHSRI